LNFLQNTRLLTKSSFEYLYIEEDKNCERHLDVRYKIARLYHKRLNESLKAINEYKIISNIAPKDHPFRRDAYEGIKELSRLNVCGT
jgi:hypothetical protein